MVTLKIILIGEKPFLKIIILFVSEICGIFIRNFVLRKTMINGLV